MMKNMPKILVVDDDDLFFEVVERALDKTEMQCKLTSALSLAEAFRCVEKESFDCILLDHKLGDGDAFVLLERLHNNPNPPSVIMLTNNENVDIAVRAMKNGVADFINKRNLSSEKLRKAIDRALDARLVFEEAEQARHDLERMSFYDELTGFAKPQPTL